MSAEREPRTASSGVLHEPGFERAGRRDARASAPCFALGVTVR
jgi:hypothetical protein